MQRFAGLLSSFTITLFLISTWLCFIATPTNAAKSTTITVEEGTVLPESSSLLWRLLKNVDWSEVCAGLFIPNRPTVVEGITITGFNTADGSLSVILDVRTKLDGMRSSPPAKISLRGTDINCQHRSLEEEEPQTVTPTKEETITTPQTEKSDKQPESSTTESSPSSPTPKSEPPQPSPTPKKPKPVTTSNVLSHLHRPTTMERPSSPKETIDIVYAVEGDYVEGLGASINSVIKNTESADRLRIRVLTRQDILVNLAEWLITEINKANKGRAQLYSVTKLFEDKTAAKAGKNVVRIPLDVKVFNDADVEGKFTVHDEKGAWKRLKSNLNYARFYLDNYWSDLEKFVYLDTDTIVQRDIAELFDKALSTDTSSYTFWNSGRHEGPHGKSGERYFAVFSNCGASFGAYFHMDNPINAEQFEGHRCAFEAGVYISNWKKWAEHNTTAQIEYWMALNKEKNLYICGSQPPLMAVFFDAYEDLHKSTDWKHLISLGHVYQAERRPEIFSDENVGGKVGIMEWNGDAKPWRPDGLWKMYWKKYALPRWSKFLARREAHKRILDDNVDIH